MRRTTLGILALAALVVGPVEALAQSTNLWVGKWKLNVAKSKYDPGPPPTSGDASFDVVNGVLRLTLDNVGAKGQKTHTVSPVIFDGKEHPVTGAANPQTRTFKSIDDRTFEWVLKVSGQTSNTTHLALSRDGKTITVTNAGKTAQGQAFKNVTVWEKQ